MQHGPVSFAWLLCPAVVYLENRVLLTACDTHGRCLAPLTRGKEAARAERVRRREGPPQPRQPERPKRGPRPLHFLSALSAVPFLSP